MDRINELERAVERLCQEQLNNYNKQAVRKKESLDCYDVILYYHRINHHKSRLKVRIVISKLNGLVATVDDYYTNNIGELPDIAYEWVYSLRKVPLGYISEWFELRQWDVEHIKYRIKPLTK